LAVLSTLSGWVVGDAATAVIFFFERRVVEVFEQRGARR
jgi:hypothetical protein